MLSSTCPCCVSLTVQYTESKSRIAVSSFSFSLYAYFSLFSLIPQIIAIILGSSSFAGAPTSLPLSAHALLKCSMSFSLSWAFISWTCSFDPKLYLWTIRVCFFASLCVQQCWILLNFPITVTFFLVFGSVLIFLAIWWFLVNCFSEIFGYTDVIIYAAWLKLDLDCFFVEKMKKEKETRNEFPI